MHFICPQIWTFVAFSFYISISLTNIIPLQVDSKFHETISGEYICFACWGCSGSHIRCSCCTWRCSITHPKADKGTILCLNFPLNIKIIIWLFCFPFFSCVLKTSGSLVCEICSSWLVGSRRNFTLLHSYLKKNFTVYSASLYIFWGNLWDRRLFFLVYSCFEKFLKLVVG